MDTKEVEVMFDPDEEGEEGEDAPEVSGGRGLAPPPHVRNGSLLARDQDAAG